MIAKKFDLFIEQGTDYSQDFPILDANGDPIDLTGATAAMQIKQSLTSTAIITLSTQNGGLVLNIPDSIITAVINAKSSDRLPVGNFLYDMKMLNAAGKTTRPYEGYAFIDGEITLVSTTTPPGQFDFSRAQNCIILTMGVM